MTKCDTRDVTATFDEIVGLEATGCEIVRVSVPTMKDAKALGDDFVSTEHLLSAVTDFGDRIGSSPLSSPSASAAAVAGAGCRGS